MTSATGTTSPNPIAASDEVLIHRALHGDPSGPEQLVERYHGRLERAILRLEGCPFATEDIVQETFLNAFRRLDAFQHQCQFYSWLFRIAINARHTYHRKYSRLTLVTNGDSALQQPVDEQDSPNDALQRQEVGEVVRNALAGLEERHRRILVLREFEQLDYSTIAQKLNIQLGTVRSRLHRARSRLRDELNRRI